MVSVNVTLCWNVSLSTVKNKNKQKELVLQWDLFCNLQNTSEEKKSLKTHTHTKRRWKEKKKEQRKQMVNLTRAKKCSCMLLCISSEALSLVLCSLFASLGWMSEGSSNTIHVKWKWFRYRLNKSFGAYDDMPFLYNGIFKDF